ncbi:MAG TPA: cache domain-containing protein, partial [Holophaga sp.]|nr:cache domain-containing protein [Holophaga sp.]
MSAIGFVATIFTVTLRAASAQKETAFAHAQELANSEGAKLLAQLDGTMDGARTLARALLGMKVHGQPQRAEANALLQGFLEGTPTLLGTSTCWEPNAFDGNDAAWANKPVHDGTGRFIPWWYRAGSKIGTEKLVDYEKPGDGDWYLKARNSKQETIMEPYFYPVEGKQVLMTTVTVPILKDDKVLGVVTADMPITGFQEIVARIKPYGSGYATLLSNAGVLVAHPDANRINTDLGADASAMKAKEAIKEGRVHTYTGWDGQLKAQVYRVFVPLAVGHTTTPWAFSITVPMERVLASVNRTRDIAIVLGILCIAATSVILAWIIRRNILTPLGGEPGYAVSITQAIAGGDLTVQVRRQNLDRTSLLASMDAMRE